MKSCFTRVTSSHAVPKQWELLGTCHRSIVVASKKATISILLMAQHTSWLHGLRVGICPLALKVPGGSVVPPDEDHAGDPCHS